MFSKVLVAKLLLVSLSAAAPNGGDYYSSDSSSVCNGGSLQCCNQMNAPGTYDANEVATLFGGVLDQISGNLGAQCSPISAVGGGTGGNWSVISSSYRIMSYM